MSKLSKEELIQRLSELGLVVDNDMKYNHLYKLFKNHSKMDLPIKLDFNIGKEFNTEVYKYIPTEGEVLIMDKPNNPLNVL